MWGAGGSGHGACSCNRCQVYRGAQGGYYNTKTIDVSAGWTYTVCAGGVYRCCERDCVGCTGCASYVNGCNLSGNFCAHGGCGGLACGNWSLNCHSTNECCRAPGDNNGDFMMGNHRGGFWNPKGVFCHCHGRYATQLLLHLSEPMLCRVLSAAGFVVVAGPFHMVMVDRVHSLTNVVVAVVKVVWVDLDLLKLLTSDIIKTPCEGSEEGANRTLFFMNYYK